MKLYVNYRKKIKTEKAGKSSSNRLATKKGNTTNTSTKMTTAKTKNFTKMTSSKSTAKTSSKITNAKITAVTSSKTTEEVFKKIATVAANGTTKVNMLKPRARKLPIAKKSKEVETTGKSSTKRLATKKGHTTLTTTKMTTAETTAVTSSKTTAKATKNFATATAKGATKASMLKQRARKVPITKTSQKIDTTTTVKSTLIKLGAQKGRTTKIFTKGTTVQTTNTTTTVSSSKTTVNASKEIATATPKGTTRANMIKPARKSPIIKTSKRIETTAT